MVLFPEYLSHVVMVYTDDEFSELIDEFTPRGFFAVKDTEGSVTEGLDGVAWGLLNTQGPLAGGLRDIDDAADAIDPLLPL